MGTITVARVLILRTRNAPDHIYVETGLPCATWPYSGTQVLEFRAARGSGEEYCAANFPGVPTKVQEIG